jgi:hypothetical protein
MHSSIRTTAIFVVASLLGACTSPQPQTETTTTRPTAAVDYSHYEAVLAAHLRGGLLNYSALRSDATSTARWKDHLAVLAGVDAAKLAPADRKAFWTNAYNTFCIEGILRSYPTGGPNEIAGFFDKKTYRVAGCDLTVNQMQYETLMPEFKDARLHFILVCSDFGCMPLEKTAFTGADIEERLTDASYRFARDTGRFLVDPKQKLVRASKLFDTDWYAKDFTGDPARPAKTAVQYMAPWLTPAEREFLAKGDYEVQIIPWDWRLNEWR